MPCPPPTSTTLVSPLKSYVVATASATIELSIVMLSLKIALCSGWAARCVQTSVPCSAANAFSPVTTLCRRWPQAAHTAGSWSVLASGRMLASTSERSPSPSAVLVNDPSSPWS